MADHTQNWHPGSFTKNFGWGNEENGLAALHRAIRVGFEDDRHDVPREVFRRRLEAKGLNFFIPANFFLFNFVDGSNDWIVYDELVFQAVTFTHSLDFDRLALLAFNLSLAGTWRGAKPWQRRPALWSNRYIAERLGGTHKWDVSKVDADDIEYFFVSDERYHARTTRKLSTNLAYLYRLGGLEQVVASRIERWWMNAAFLAADRFTYLSLVPQPSVASLREMFDSFAFLDLTGGQTVEKRYALGRVVQMFVSVGGVDRFSRSAAALASGKTNDGRPFGVIDKKLPRAPKSLPPGVDSGFGLLDASFGYLDYDELERFDPDAFVREASLRALKRMREMGISPTMTSDELMKLLRN
jgi:hypothetical protein